MIELPSYDVDWSTGRVTGPQLINQVRIDGDGFIIDKYKIYHQALSSGNQELIGSCLRDDSIFAYAALNWEGSPIRMKYYQDAILNDPWPRIDVEAANQQGKSFSLCVKAATQFLRSHDKNYTIGLISKSQSQNSMNMRMIRKMLKDSKWSYNKGSNDSQTVMVHEHPDGTVTTLVCSVATTGALGFPFDLLLLDEFEFWENPEGLEYMYDQVLEPRTFQTKGQIILYSNPNGKNFVSENLHKRMSGNQPQFHVYNINYLDNPANKREDWEARKAYVHPIIFASTMAAQRTEAEGSALTDADIRSTYDSNLTEKGFHLAVDKDVYAFLDLGFINDQSCLVLGWLSKESDEIQSHFNFVVKLYPQSHPIPELWNRDVLDSVPSMLKRFAPKLVRFELDLTGKEGNEVLANEAGISCSGVKMSGQWKATHYERFVTLTKQGRIKVSWEDNYVDGHNKNFEFQARSLRMSTKMPDGRTRPYPLYHHSKETDHDDILDAVVGCLSLMDEEMTSTPEVTFFERKDSEESQEEDMYETAYRLNRNTSHNMFYGGM